MKLCTNTGMRKNVDEPPRKARKRVDVDQLNVGFWKNRKFSIGSGMRSSHQTSIANSAALRMAPPIIWIEIQSNAKGFEIVSMVNEAQQPQQ